VCEVTKIDFDEIFDGRYARKPYATIGQHVLDLGPVQGLVRGCSLCNLFAAMAITDETFTSCELLLASTKFVFLDRRNRNSYKPSWSSNFGLDDTFLLFLEPSWIKTDDRAWPSRQWAREKGYLSSVQPTMRSGNFGFRLFLLEFLTISLSRTLFHTALCITVHIGICRSRVFPISSGSS
jgi:hypothetical protein